MGRPSKSVVYKLDVNPLGDMDTQSRAMGKTVLEQADKVRGAVHELDWKGETANATIDRGNRDYAQVRKAIEDGFNKLAQAYANGKNTMGPMIDTLKSEGKGFEADSFDVSEIWKVTDKFPYDLARTLAGGNQTILDELAKVQAERANEADTGTAKLQKLADELGVADENTNKAITDALTELGALTPSLDGIGGRQDEPAKRSASAAAFERVYGRAPTTPNDWRMADALNPNSYAPKAHGAPAEIVAGRFTPQPGKGVVRSNMFIPAENVVNTAKDLEDVRTGRFFPRNFGDNRGPDANADVEASRVSVFVDYENGVVVTRQNPTANVDGQRGGAAAAVPEVHVVQGQGGKLTIDYDTYDAYENPVGKAMGLTVNGRVTLDPHADGTVGIGGNTTIYPSMETYQYRAGMPVAQLQWDPANSGSEYGPGTSLSRHHWVGDATIAPVRPDIPSWKWELENANPFGGDPFIDHTTRLTNPSEGAIPTIGTGR